MNAEPNVFIALLAGLLSFLSPCILPLIPSYLSYIGGVGAGELSERSGKRGLVLVRTFFFILGFTLVFVVLGAAFTGTGLLFGGASQIITAVSGAVVLLLGLNILFDFMKFLNFEKRFSFKLPGGTFGAFLMGAAFGGGWTPCIGPILAGILFLASQSGSMIVGITYLIAYSLGLGIPFLLTGLFFERFMRVFSRLKRSVMIFKIAGGIVLIGIGLLMVFGRLQAFNAVLASFSVRLAILRETYPIPVRLVSGIIPILPGIALLLCRGSVRSDAEESHAAGAGPIAPVSTRRARNPRAVRYVIVGILMTIGGLQLAGMIDLVSLIASWFAFQGI